LDRDPSAPGGSEPARDELLMAEVVRGQADALATLYDRYAAQVMGLALRATGDQAAAEEILHETFWRVWQNAAAFEPGRGAFTSWLFQIARNLAIDAYRRGRSRLDRQPQPSPEALDELPSPGQSVDEQIWTAAKHSQVRLALETLPAAQRQVIELAYFRGLTRHEIAEATGEALGTIHTRARLGLQKLREALLAQHYED
jgi:RNA polymerase sigma-70 factor (ECF subfamily)